MKLFYRLLQYEFGGLLRGTLLLALGAIVTPLLFLNAHMQRDFAEVQRYEHIFNESGALLSLLIYFAALHGLLLKSVYAGYWGGKSVYSLLTLPVRREYLYLSKMSAFMVSLLVFWAASAVGIWLGFELLDSKVLHATNGLGVSHNGMFLAVIRSDFLSLILPLGASGLLSTISIGAALATGVYYCALCERSKRYWGFVVAAAAMFLMIRVFTYRIGLPDAYFSDFNLNVSSYALLAFAAWFVGHGIRLVKRGAIV